MSRNINTKSNPIVNFFRLIHLPDVAPSIQYQANLLQIILYVNLFIPALFIGYGIFGNVHDKVAGTIITLIVMMFYLRALHIVRQGKIKDAGRIVIGVSWMTTSLSIFNAGGLYSSGMMGLMTLLVIAVLVLDERDRFIVYISTLAYCAFLYIVEVSGHLPEAPFKDLPLRVMVLYLVATTLYFVIRYHLIAMKKAEVQVAKLQIDAERQRVQRDLTQNLTHDLRTPLATLQTTAYLIRKRYETDMPLEDHIAKLEKEVRRVNNMIGDLFLLDSFDETNGTHRTVDLRHVLHVCVENTRPFAHSRAIRILFEDESAGQAYIEGDRKQLISVFNKLLINAVHYGHNEGVIHIRLYIDGEQIFVSVEDDGIGIAREHQEKIFERFYRVDPARTHRENQGAGVGLNTVQRIVQLHGGHIQLVSEAGKGSTFTITLPSISS